MKLLSRLNATRENGGPRKFTFEISTSGVVSVGIVVVLGMCWVFILGILVGRGYKPEAAVPQLAQIMPTTEARMPDNTTSQAPPSVLKPEDLQFMEDIHGQPGSEGGSVPESKAAADPKKTAPPAKPHDLTEVRPVAPARTAAPAAPAAPAPKAVPDEPKAVAAAKVEPKMPFDKKASVRYAATYQVASFPAREQAETHVKQLAKKGITASVTEAKSNNSKVFRVTIQIKGSDAEITDSLKRTGEKGSILLGKKPL
ncbi:SPOR domain-containing protein [Desulfovibrio aerotolerans]|uniref:SPOR domain-containing protein n=1 Tax=Solidesulfovibrio aerotolerans TaxID=295255 RepID=A0A7C9MVU4_9BACT|nr:SPOR domain-containing protein [Solidesulfovibrio aerotolerans]MYL83874.1 SPOR domain-containing protein [Solidesulfovibrio aerotolerans]